MSNKGTSRALPGSSDSLTPSSYSIRAIEITTNAGLTIDISNLVNKFEIQESIDSPFLNVVLVIVDATNFLEEHKLSGNEKIFIHVSRSPNSNLQDPQAFKLTLKIAEIFGYVRLEPTKQFYRFRCVSQHVYNDQTKILSTGFRGTIGDLVHRITRDLEIKNKSIETSSKSIIKGVYPSIKPLEAIRWLMRSAYDNGTPYYFYETAKEQEVQFKSYNTLIGLDPYDFYEFRPGFKNSIGTKEYYDEVRRRIISIDGDLNMGQLYPIAKGAYSSTLHTLDIATKTFKKQTYSYKGKKINANKPFPEDKIFNKTYDTLDESTNYYISLNSKAFNDVDNYHAPTDISLNRYESHLRTIDFQSLNIFLSGDFELSVGQLIELKFIKATDPQHLDTDNLRDKYLSGQYMITRITHVFDEEFKQRVTIKRDSLGVDLNA